MSLVRSLGKEPRKCDQQLKPCDTTRHVVTRLGCQDDFARLQEMFGRTNATQLHFSDSQGQNAIGCTWTVSIGWNTPWKFNISSLKIGHPKRKGSSSKQHFSGASCWTSVAEVGRCMSGAGGWLESLLANMRTRWEMRNVNHKSPKVLHFRWVWVRFDCYPRWLDISAHLCMRLLEGSKGHEIYSWRWILWDMGID